MSKTQGDIGGNGEQYVPPNDRASPHPNSSGNALGLTQYPPAPFPSRHVHSPVIGTVGSHCRLLRLCIRFALIPPLLHLPAFLPSLLDPHARSPSVGCYYPDPRWVYGGGGRGLSITMKSFTVFVFRHPQSIAAPCFHLHIDKNTVSHMRPSLGSISRCVRERSLGPDSEGGLHPTKSHPIPTLRVQSLDLFVSSHSSHPTTLITPSVSMVCQPGSSLIILSNVACLIQPPR